LLELSTNKSMTLQSRTRATRSLARPEIRANASPAALVLVDLKAATACSARRDVLERVKETGDGRCLATLKAMRNPRGCGFMGVRDCWGCLRKEDILDDT